MARLLVAASSQYLTNITLTVPARPVTMACWFRPTTLGAVQVLMGFTDSGNLNLRRLRIAAGGTLGAQEFNDPTSAIAESVGTLTVGVWSLCVGVFTSATDRRVYLNTETVQETSSVTPTGLDRLYVGANVQPLLFANGDLGEAAVWAAGLSASEVTMLRNGTPASKVRPSALRHYWTLAGGTSPEPDPVGGQPLTLVNAPAVSSALPPVNHTSRTGGHNRRSRRGR